MSSSSSSLSDSESDEDEYSGHILEIDLDSQESARSILTARRATTSQFHHENQPAQEELIIAASILHHSGKEQEPSISIITRSPDSQISSPKERWLLVERIYLSAENEGY